MQQTQLQIHGNTIAVYESDGNGPAVLLIHGNSAAAQTFEHQLTGDFGEKHRVVALDLPGHGKSSPARDPEKTYCLGGYAGVVVGLVQRLALARPVVVGWSLGGHIALEAVDQLPGAAGFLIYGTPPLAIPPAMEQAFLPNPAMAAAFSATVSEQEAEAFTSACLKPGVETPPGLRDAFLDTDGRARAHVGASVGAANYKDEVEIVANMETPLAIVHGAEEQLVNLEYIQSVTIPSLWRGDVQIVEDAGHAPHWECPNAFNTLLAEFVADVG